MPREHRCRCVRGNVSSRSRHCFQCDNSIQISFVFSRIEHLFPETEMNLTYNIFGFMKPKVIVFTTPNSDYNILFGAAKFPTGFRHDDHKFEWSREQFRDWYVRSIIPTLLRIHLILQFFDFHFQKGHSMCAHAIQTIVSILRASEVRQKAMNRLANALKWRVSCVEIC